MAKQKRKRTKAEKIAKKERQRLYEWVFINGKQKRVKRQPTIEGMDAVEFIAANAGPIWLHQNEMWELIKPEPELPGVLTPDNDDVPFYSPTGVRRGRRRESTKEPRLISKRRI